MSPVLSHAWAFLAGGWFVLGTIRLSMWWHER
jgi:hypothetical protein